ncbi:MAG: GNAT family N-acetyltransferase [Marinicella sp.]
MKFNSTILNTSRLVLRPVSLHDVDDVFHLFKDPEAMKYWSDPPMNNIDQAIEKIKRNIKDNESGTAWSLAMELKESQQMIGQLSLFNIHTISARAEIGYVLSRSEWRKGLMSEALQTFISFCFSEMGLRRLEADIDPDNSGSAAILQNMGFVLEGLLKERWNVGGLITDSEVYGLLKSNWVKQP